VSEVRHARVDDIPDMVELGRRFAAMSVNSRIGYDEIAVEALFGHMIANPMTCLLTNGTGIFGGYVAPVFFNPNSLIADEMFWYAESGGMDLLNAFEAWARDMGAARITLSCMENEKIAPMLKLYKRKGYDSVERKMVKVMQ
jgi:hypothetical protein